MLGYLIDPHTKRATFVHVRNERDYRRLLGWRGVDALGFSVGGHDYAFMADTARDENPMALPSVVDETCWPMVFGGTVIVGVNESGRPRSLSTDECNHLFAEISVISDGMHGDWQAMVVDQRGARR
jgi:hypothetical protein